MNTDQKPQVGKSIFFSIISIVAFYICFVVIVLAFSAVIAILGKIPVVSSLLSFLFKMRGDTPGILAYLLGASLAYNATVWMLHRFHDSESSENLSLKITGMVLLVLNVVFLVVNILGKSSFFPNIVVGVAGLSMFMRGKS